LSWITANLVFAQQDGGPGGALDPFTMFMPFILIAMLFYFLLWLPEKKKRRKHEELLGSLKKNDRIVTVGGIYGKVVNIAKDAEDLTINVDENSNTRVRITRSSVGQIIREEDDSKEG
tara:strand:+ start:96 stop:449 length:354 start_codon:yes stop_codon:yes gene_type:complete